MTLESLLQRLVGGKQIAQQENIPIAGGFTSQQVADDAGPLGFDMCRIFRRATPRKWASRAPT